MRKTYFYVCFSFLLSSVSCKNDLFPFDADEPLILAPTQYFDSKRLNNLCEVQYFEESIYSDLVNKKPIQNNYVYKAFKEWNDINSNIKFAYQPDLTKCNLYVYKNSNIDLFYNRTQDDLGLIRIDGSITNKQDLQNYTGLFYNSANYTSMSLPYKYPDYSDDRRLDRRNLMYFIGRYLGLPDSKDRNSCMYPYLVKTGPVGIITEEDKIILNTLYTYSPCGNIDIEVKSATLNNDGSANLSVSYTNSNTKEKVYGCGVVLSEDSTILNIDRSSFYYFQKNSLDNDYYGKISKLNADTKYYIKAFSLDANGITYGKKITTLNIPNRQHDKWITIPFEKNIVFTSQYNSYFEYNGKLYLGLVEKDNSEGYLYQYDPLTGKVNTITVSNFPGFSRANYNQLFYANGYIYVFNKYYSASATDTRFKRLSLKTFTWEALPSMLGDFIVGYTYNYNVFSNDQFIFLITYDGVTKSLQRYDIQKNKWTLLNTYKISEISPYDGLNYYSSYYFFNTPSYYNNQFYFFNTNFKKSYDYINDKWVDLDIQSYVNSNVIPNPDFRYNDNYTVAFQNQIIKYNSNSNYINRIQVNNLGNSNSYDIYVSSPKPYDALKSGLNNFDRHSLITIDVAKKTVKELCNPSNNIKLRYLDRYFNGTFIIATNDNIYMGLIDANTNFCTGLIKYIP